MTLIKAAQTSGPINKQAGLFLEVRETHVGTGSSTLQRAFHLINSCPFTLVVPYFLSLSFFVISIGSLFLAHILLFQWRISTRKVSLASKQLKGERV